jgi:hypothetical protein
MNQNFYGNQLESFHVKHLFVKPLDIDPDAFIFSLCFFSLNACAKIKDEFRAEIMKVEIKSVVPCLFGSIKYYWKNFTHNITILCDKL